MSSRLHPDDDKQLAIFFSNRAECYLQMHQFDEALLDTARALAIDPSHAKSESRKERALEGKRNPPQFNHNNNNDNNNHNNSSSRDRNEPSRPARAQSPSSFH